MKSLQNTTYVAISHSWGDPSWQRLPEVEGEIWVSKSKAKFILNQLQSIVGEDYFWMDILCVDQRRKHAAIQVPKHIPSIFRSAQRTVVVRDGAGFRDCCVQAAGSPGMWFSPYLGSHTRSRLHQHCETMHGDECFVEGIFSRLWIVQEILISDNLQFVSEEQQVIRFGEEKYFAGSSKVQIRRLEMIAVAWAAYGRGDSTSGSRATHFKFIDAFLSCGFTSRPPVADMEPQFWQNEVADDILDPTLQCLLFPGFYLAVVENRVADCSHQVEKLSGNVNGMTDQEDDPIRKCPLNRHIPNFLFISRLIRVLLHCEFAQPPRPFLLNSNSDFRVSVENALGLSTHETLQHIQKAIRRSSVLWRVTVGGELGEGELGACCTESRKMGKEGGHLSGPQNLRKAILTVREIAKNRLADTYQYPGSEEQAIDKVGKELILRLVALISCDLGLSAFGWSTQTLLPVLVDFKGTSFLALAPGSVVADKNYYKFTLVESKKYSYAETSSLYVLLAWDQRCESEAYSLCLFPPDVDVRWEDTEDGNVSSGGLFLRGKEGVS